MYIYGSGCWIVVLWMGHGQYHVYGSGYYQSCRTVSYSVIVSCLLYIFIYLNWIKSQSRTTRGLTQLGGSSVG